MKTRLITLSEVLSSFVGRGAHIASTLPVQTAIAKGNLEAAEQLTNDEGSSLFVDDAERCERHGRADCRRCANLRKPEGVMGVKAAHADPWRAVDAAESGIVKEMDLLRCLADLRRVQAARLPKQKDALVALQRKCPLLGQGELTIACLEAYYEWAPRSPYEPRSGDTEVERAVSAVCSRHIDRALAAVYAWRCRVLGEAAPDALVLAETFEKGLEKTARAKAVSLYSDSYLVLAEWVLFWNRRRSSL